MLKMVPQESRIYRFGAFRIEPGARSLTHNQQPVPLTPKAFDLLLHMAENPGRLLTKNELLGAVWPDSIVEEGNLSQNVFLLRKALSVAGEENRCILTVPGRGYQFAAPVEADVAGLAVHAAQTQRTAVVEEEQVDTVSGKTPPARGRGRQWIWIAAAMGVVAAAGAVATWKRPHRVPAFPMVVIADFRNATGDPGMDRVLDSAIEIDLKQSPYLSFLSLARVRETLAQMQRKKEADFTPEVAREVCQRSNAQILLTGVIAKFGRRYLLTLDATDCASGGVLAESKREAAGPEGVPHAIDLAAADLRDRLGESQASIARFGTDLFAENTGSLEALKRYSEAKRLGFKGRYAEAVPLFERAIELDPQFAMAYADLGGAYVNLGERALAAVNFAKAYGLREKEAEQDRLFIIASYHDNVTGDLYQSILNLRTWTDVYPRDPTPWSHLADLYTQLGRPELGIEAARQGLALDPEKSVAYTILARGLLHAGKFDAAKSVCDKAQAKGFSGADLHSLRMQIAAARHDRAGIDVEIAWTRTHSDSSRVKLNEGMLAFAAGNVHRGLELFQESARSYREQGLESLSAKVLLASTRMLAEEGHTSEARKLLDEVPVPAGMTDPVVAMAEVGEEARATAIFKQELALHPADTLWVGTRGPQIQAAAFLARHQPREAIDVLRPSIPYDLRNYDLPLLRGKAYLGDHQPGAAELEFRKILDHPGVDPLSYEFPLAQLELARALAANGEVDQSHAAYEAFFALWKDADSGEPLLRDARQENRLLTLRASPHYVSSTRVRDSQQIRTALSGR
jgi:pentatricopeptide repeat protein